MRSRAGRGKGRVVRGPTRESRLQKRMRGRKKCGATVHRMSRRKHCWATDTANMEPMLATATGRRRMNDDEEQPIAIAFVDGPGDSILEELVFDQDLFWGNIHRNLQTHRDVRWLTARNYYRIQGTLEEHSPLPFRMIYIVMIYVHPQNVYGTYCLNSSNYRGQTTEPTEQRNVRRRTE